MPDNKISFGVDLNLAGFDKGVSDVKNKLKELEQARDNLSKSKSTLQGEGMMGQFASQAYGSFMKESKQGLNNQYASQRREMANNNLNIRALQSQQRELEKIQKVEKGLTNEKRERLTLIKQETQALLERQKVLTNEAAAVKQTLGRFSDDGSGKGGTPTGAGGGQLPPKTDSSIKKGITDLLRSVSVAAIVRGAVNTAQFQINKEQGSLRATGSAASIASQEMAEERQGEGFKGIFYAQQRKQAMNMAIKKKEEQGALDFAKIGGGILAGAATGAMFGGIKGAIGGGILGGVGSVFSSEKMTARAFDKDYYEKLTTEQGMKDYRANLASQKALDPTRTFAEKKYSRDANKYLNLQLTGAMTDEELLGANSSEREKNKLNQMMQLNSPLEQAKRGPLKGMGIYGNSFIPTGTSPLQGGIQADNFIDNIISQKTNTNNQPIDLTRQSRGYLRDQMEGTFDDESNQKFTEANILAKRRQIIAQGGTGDQDLARSAAKAERNLGMVDSGSIFAKLAGAGGNLDSRKSEDAVKRIMTDAVKSGVDLSKMPVELNRFSKVAVELATKGGGFSQSAVDVLAQSTTGFSQREMQSASGAFEDANRRGKQTKGFRGQIAFGMMTGDSGKEILGSEMQQNLKKDTKTMIQLAGLTSKDLDQNKALALSLSEKLGGGKEGEKNIREYVKAQEFEKQMLIPGSKNALKKLNEKTKGMKSQEKKDFLENTAEGRSLQLSAQQAMITNVSGVEQMSQMDQKSALFASSSIGNTQSAGVSKQVEDAFNKERTGAFVSKKESEAVGQVTDIKGLNKHIDDLGAAAKSHVEHAELYNRTFSTFIEALENGAGSMGTVSKQLEQVIDNLADMGAHPESAPASSEPE